MQKDKGGKQMRRIYLFLSMVAMMIITTIVYAAYGTGLVPILFAYMAAYSLVLFWQINGKRDWQKMAAFIFLGASLFMLIGVFGSMDLSRIQEGSIIRSMPVLLFAIAATISSYLFVPDNMKEGEGI